MYREEGIKNNISFIQTKSLPRDSILKNINTALLYFKIHGVNLCFENNVKRIYKTLNSLLQKPTQVGL